MDDKNCDERLVAVEQRAVSNTRRIDKLEQDNERLHEMAASIKVWPRRWIMRKAKMTLTISTVLRTNPPHAWSRLYLRSL